MSTSVPEYGSLSSSFEMSEMAAIKNALNGRSVNSLKVKDLRDELEKRKLSKSGRKTELVKRLKESILSGSGEIQIPRHNVNQPSPRPSAVINLDDTSSSPEQQSHTCNGYKSLKDLYDRLENEVNKLKDSYRSRLTDSREIQSTCKSCQNQQRIQEENRALREQLQLMKGNLDKTKEERDSLQMVVSLLSKELYNFRLDSKEAFNESPSVDPKVSDTKWSDTKADTKQNNGSSKSQSSKTTKNHQSKSSKKKPPNKSSHNSSNTLNHNQERSSPTTVIIGDSIIRNIQGWQLGKEVGHRVVVNSFAGATTSDMSHYVKPTLDKKPDQIILHAGTNDLGKLSPSEIADNIVDLAREIESSTDAQVIISELVTRSDLSDSGDVDAVNKRLRKFCNQRQWHFILHDDIHSTDLNRGGLHLGETGQQDWSSIESYSDPNLMWAAWKQLFLECVNKHAPLHVKRARVSKSPWITPYLKKRMHDRDILKLKASRSKDANDWLQFKKCRNLVNNEIKKAKELFYKRALDENEGNSRQTWRIVNELMSRKTNNCSIKEIKSNGNSIYGPPEMADAFNNHFSSIGPKLASQIYSNNGPSHLHYLEGTDKRFELKCINPSKVFSLLSKLCKSKATGLDMISSRLLRECADLIADPLCFIFNQSIRSGVFPQEWKCAKVIPLFKEGDHSDLNNYRPISIVPIVAKVFEPIWFSFAPFNCYCLVGGHKQLGLQH
ncbi:uncharacterized protein [Pocillopora verrucosa]|uniref:uncharacterized protein n=1 Tax=Pocillopora verrucosa TaxID=203993 RepID=UPI00333EA19C